MRVSIGINSHLDTKIASWISLTFRNKVLFDPKKQTSIFWISDRPEVATAFLISLCVAAIIFTLGIFRKGVAIFLLFGWACLFNRNPLIANPSLAYVGVMLLLSLLVPSGEGLAVKLNKSKPDWYYPSGVYWTAWWLLAIGYTFSGIIKLQSPSWVDGTAMLHLLENPLARPGWIRNLMLVLPSDILKALTWFSITAEILFVPLSLFRRGRFFIWSTLLAMHIGILMVIDFFDLTAAMLLIHLFTFDPEWLPTVGRHLTSRWPLKQS